jgi:hypothetical protein
MIVCEGDRVFYDDHPKVIYRVLSVRETGNGRRGELEITESDEPEEYPVGIIDEDGDLATAKFIGEFVEEG